MSKFGTHTIRSNVNIYSTQPCVPGHLGRPHEISYQARGPDNLFAFPPPARQLQVHRCTYVYVRVILAPVVRIKLIV